MTNDELRDAIANRVLVALITARLGMGGKSPDRDRIGDEAYRWADAMLRARERSRATTEPQA